MLLQTLMYAMQQMDNGKQLRQYHVPPVSIWALQCCFRRKSQPTDVSTGQHMYRTTSKPNALLESMKFGA